MGLIRQTASRKMEPGLSNGLRGESDMRVPVSLVHPAELLTIGRSLNRTS